MTVNPAAGPLTLKAEPLARAMTVPPTMPAIIPENNGAPEANAIPKQRGNATRKTTNPEGRSFFRYLKVNPVIALFSESISKHYHFVMYPKADRIRDKIN